MIEYRNDDGRIHLRSTDDDPAWERVEYHMNGRWTAMDTNTWGVLRDEPDYRSILRALAVEECPDCGDPAPGWTLAHTGQGPHVQEHTIPCTTCGGDEVPSSMLHLNRRQQQRYGAALDMGAAMPPRGGCGMVDRVCQRPGCGELNTGAGDYCTDCDFEHAD